MAAGEGGCRKTVSANADKMAAKENCCRRLDSDHRYNTRNPEMATRTWLQWKVAAKIWLAPTPTNQLRKKVATEKWLGTTSVYVPAEA